MFVDADALRIDKILGSGKVQTRMVVRAKEISSTAREKIEQAGGECILLS